MNLQTHIPRRLWDAISSAYEAGNFSHAILESMHVITEVLREKAGIDGDGNQLVGQALGGEEPRIRLNSLQTDSEKNIQRGFENILRGMYSAIRNPRSHESAIDPREHADSIICFVGYLLSVIDASREVFSIEDFMRRVSDPDFVDSVRYAELLLAEVPPSRVGDAIIAVFGERKKIALQKRRHFCSQIIKKLNQAQLANYLAVVSSALKVTNDETDIRTAIQMLSPEIWPQLQESVRIRIENKLINGIREGEILSDGKVTSALSTWCNSFIKAFTMKRQAATAILLKLQDEDADDRHYVASYFFHYLPEVFESPDMIQRAVKAIARAIKDGDGHLRRALVAEIDAFPDEWRAAFLESLSDITNPDNPEIVLKDGVPFCPRPKVAVRTNSTTIFRSKKALRKPIRLIEPSIFQTFYSVDE